MQAIILAAGMGRRLGKLTKNNTKCMVEVNGERLIDRALSQLSRLNLNRVIIVVGYEGQKLIDHIGHRYDDKVKIEYINNPIYDKTNNIYSLALAKDKLVEDDTLLLESDLIYEDSLLKMLVADSYPNLALVAKYESWMDGTMVRIDENNNILNFVPKKAFDYGDIDLYYKTVNIYKFSKEFSANQYVPFLEAYSKAMGDNEYYEEVLRVLTILDKTGLKALPIGDKKWYEIDDIQDLDIAETIFATTETKLAKYHKRFGGYWRFPQMLDFCYLVNPYYPSQKMKDEMRANFDILLTEYPSGMFVNSLLAGKYFGVRSEYICVGNGAAELIKCVMERHAQGNVGVTFPTFEEYPNRLSEDRIVRFIPQNADFRYNVDDLCDFFAQKQLTTLLLVNPDNPSGNYIPKADILRLATWCKDRNIELIVDESFVDFTTDYAHNSLLDDELLETYPNLSVVKSISKSYGVPGLRLGVFASSNVDVIKRMKKEVSIWNINSFAEYYMQIFGKYEKDYFTACEKFIFERNRFQTDLQTLNWLRVIPSQANYFLCELTDKFTSAQLCKILLDRFNILIKDCASKSAFEGKNYIRIAVRDQKDNTTLFNALKTL